MVQEYYKSLDGDKNLSEHFKVREFACNDGTDKILIENDLIPILERFRQYVENSVTINSGYRTPTYNKTIGGAGNSYHIYGRACDVGFSYYFKYLTTVDLMARFFNTVGMRGIIKYSWGCHIDNRDTSYHADSNGKIINYGKVNIPLYSNIKYGDRNNDVAVMQFILKYKYGYDIDVDGVFGDGTLWVVKDYQRLMGINQDGIVGQITWGLLIK